MNYAETAAFLPIDGTTLRGMVHRKKIPHVRISDRVVIFERAALEAWLRENAVPVEVKQDDRIGGEA